MFEQIGRNRHFAPDDFHYFGVVDGVGDAVGAHGCGKVAPKDDVDNEYVAYAPLGFEDTVVREQAQAVDFYAFHEFNVKPVEAIYRRNFDLTVEMNWDAKG